MPEPLRGARLGPVRIRSSDAERLGRFYEQVLGLAIDGARDGATVVRAPRSGEALLEIEHAPEAPLPPTRSTGLFHVALLYPTRGALARAIERVRDAGWPFQGFSDHAVSEAAYLADLERNGLELYADRPRETWRRDGDELHITTEPLDLEGVLGHAGDPRGEEGDDPAVGHVHLAVASLEKAEAFYVDRLGFRVMARAYPGALFVGADGYHHHLGLNVWRTLGAPAPPAESRGLVSISVTVPDADHRAALLQGAPEGRVEGPWGVGVEIRAP